MVGIFDFDGTIVKENSSRIFEKKIYKYISHPTKKLLFLIFYKWPTTRWIWQNLFRLLYRLSGKKWDSQLWLTFFFFGYYIALVWDKIIRDVIPELSLNTKVVESLWLYKDIYILSNGIDKVIHAFCQAHNLNFPIIASEIWDTEWGITYLTRLSDVNTKLLSIEQLRNNYKNVTYYTDDQKEANLVSHKFNTISTQIDLGECIYILTL